MSWLLSIKKAIKTEKRLHCHECLRPCSCCRAMSDADELLCCCVGPAAVADPGWGGCICTPIMPPPPFIALSLSLNPSLSFAFAWYYAHFKFEMWGSMKIVSPLFHSTWPVRGERDKFSKFTYIHMSHIKLDDISSNPTFLLSPMPGKRERREEKPGREWRYYSKLEDSVHPVTSTMPNTSSLLIYKDYLRVERRENSTGWVD